MRIKSNSVGTPVSRVDPIMMTSNERSIDTPWANSSSGVLIFTMKGTYIELHCVQVCSIAGLGEGSSWWCFFTSQLLPRTLVIHPDATRRKQWRDGWTLVRTLQSKSCPTESTDARSNQPKIPTCPCQHHTISSSDLYQGIILMSIKKKSSKDVGHA